jgi:hypothetical protein
MTRLWRGLKNFGSGAKKHEKIQKVTSSQDDGFVGVLKNLLVGFVKTTEIKKKSQPLGMTILFKTRGLRPNQ